MRVSLSAREQRLLDDAEFLLRSIAQHTGDSSAKTAAESVESVLGNFRQPEVTDGKE